MEYEVNVNGKEYKVLAARLTSSANIKNDDPTAAQMCLEAIKLEYMHCTERANKLDNKIYILLTIYAFLFALPMSLITKIPELAMLDSITKLFLHILYAIGLFANIALFLILLFKLISLLQGITVKRLDPDDIVKGDIFAEQSKTVSRAIGNLYLDAIKFNNKHLEQRYKDYNWCTKLLKPIIFLTVMDVVIASVLLGGR